MLHLARIPEERINNFQRGDLVPASWTPTGGGTAVLQIKNHNIDISALLVDVTHTGLGGVTGRIGQKIDAAGSINADFDLDFPPYGNPPLIVPATSGICVFGVSPAKGIQIPSIVERLRFQSAVETAVQYSFDVKCNRLAGALVFPSL